ncbi:MAG TPA: PEP-CTERM sorting domain-containing protein, partial [Pirellulales bacterium]|nr:PEP-CTERM sorting domain-containing protein [Pirellulales bacterium]
WDSPEVTLYTNSNHTSSVQATLSEGGATNWSNPTQVSGPNDFTFTGNPLTAPSGQFISFCIELTQDISLNHTYTVDAIPLDMAPKPVSGQLTSGMGPTAAGLIEELWAAHFHDIFYQPNSSDPNLQSVQNSNAAAFQLAIWKLEYDGGQYLDFSEGSLQVAVGDSDDLLDPSVLTAKSWLKDIDLNGNGPKASLLALTGHGSINFQDQVVQVPEPSSLVFISLGALGMAVARRGRRRGQ